MKRLLLLLINTVNDLARSVAGSILSGVIEGRAQAAATPPPPPQVIVIGGAQPPQAPPQPPQPVAPPPPPGTPFNQAAANAVNLAASGVATVGGQIAQGANQLVAQIGPAAARVGDGIAAAVDDAWVPPAIALFVFYMMYMFGLVLLLPDAHHHIMDISSHVSAATHGWYTLAFCLHILAVIVVMGLAAIAVAFPTPGDRLHFRVTVVGMVIMLITIPLAPLAMGSALGSAIHSARLAGVPLRYLPDLYSAGNTMMVIGVVVAFLWYAILYAFIETADAVADAVSDDDASLEQAHEWLGKWGGLILTILMVRFTAMTSFPSPQLTDDFLIYGLILLVVGLLLFKATDIQVQKETWQKVAITFLLIIVSTTVWTWLKTRHGLEVDQVTNQLSAQRGQLERIWDIWVDDLEDSFGLIKKHGGFGFVMGVGKGILFSAIGTFFLWATGVSWKQAKGAHWRKIVFVPIFLIGLAATLAMLISDLSIVFGWLSRLR